MVSPDSLGTACPLSGRNSTYRSVQISETSSERVKVVAWLCGTKRDTGQCLTAFDTEIKKHFPDPKQKSVLTPEASAILGRMREDAVARAAAHMDHVMEEIERRNERAAEESVRDRDRANDEFRMREMDARIDRIENAERARQFGIGRDY
jgi:hypothetical protein